MNNFSYSRPSPCEDIFSVSFGIRVENHRPDGTVTLDLVKDPYEGLQASSFSLDAQLQAGVPLNHVGPISNGGLSSIDENNRRASLFMSNLQNQPKD